MAEKVLSQVEFEIEQIDRLFEAYADLLRHSQRTTPDLIEITALATVLILSTTGWRTSFCLLQRGSCKMYPRVLNGTEIYWYE